MYLSIEDAKDIKGTWKWAVKEIQVLPACCSVQLVREKDVV